MALQRAHPTLVGNDNGDRLALDERFLDGGEIVLGRVSELRAALAERRLRPKDVANFSDLLADLGPLLAFRAEEGLDALQLAAEILVLSADFHFLKLAQGAQAHVEDGIGL